MRIKLFFHLIISLFVLSQLNAQTYKLNVRTNFDQNELISLADIDKIFFQDNDVFLDLATSESKSFNMNNMLVMNFEFMTLNRSVNEDEVIRFFPNPTKDFLYIKDNKKNPLLISIYSITGEMVYKVVQNANLPIDVRSLAEGIYIIKLNDKSFRFVKL